MIIAVDFDGSVVDDRHAYDDLSTPLTFKAGAREALWSLKRAGHTLLLWSGRASRALLEDPRLDPLERAGVRPLDRSRWERGLEVNLARHQQMLDFIERELPGVFDAVDDGYGGKPSVDLFLDDKALRLGFGPTAMQWAQVSRAYGEPIYGPVPGETQEEA